MLNSLDTMRRYSVWFTFFYLIAMFFLLSFFQVETEEVFISSPVPGQAVQGLVEIIGSANPDSFEKYSLSFYLQDSTNQTGFLIESNSESVESGKLGNWETSNITDDTYMLELRVSQTDGNELVFLVEDIRVRNYTAIETSTPEPIIAPTELVATQTAISGEDKVIAPNTTPPSEVAPNPAEINLNDLQNSIVQGVILGGAGLALLILYILIKNRD